MRRSTRQVMQWATRLARGAANDRLRRAAAAADVLHDTKMVGGALVWDRHGKMTMLYVYHDSGRKTVDVELQAQGNPPERRGGVRAPGLAAIVLHAWGFGRKRARIAQERFCGLNHNNTRSRNENEFAELCRIDRGRCASNENTGEGRGNGVHE